jgi:hypothetical protein
MGFVFQKFELDCFCFGRPALLATARRFDVSIDPQAHRFCPTVQTRVGQHDR